MLAEKKEAAMRAFRAQDTDRSGFIDCREFFNALRALDQILSWVRLLNVFGGVHALTT